MGIWVRLTSRQNIDAAGVQKSYRPGDWVEVGKSTARSWVLQGLAEEGAQGVFEPGEGVGVVSPDPQLVRSRMRRVPGLTIATSTLENTRTPAYPRTLYWDPAVKLRPDLVPVGFSFLDRWDVAAVLHSYDELAADISNQDERAATEAVIRDLRVPYYNPGVFFVRDSAAGRLFLEEYSGPPGFVTTRITPALPASAALAMLRALYRSRPLLLALPTTWIG